MGRRAGWLLCVGLSFSSVAACGSDDGGGGAGGGSSGGSGGTPSGGASSGGSAGSGGQSSGGTAGSGGNLDASSDGTAGQGGTGGAPPVDDLASNRQRLLEKYFAYLKAHVTTPQTNGLSGQNVASACEVWQKLDDSARAVFLTITARLQGSRLGNDGSSMLFHVTDVYRIAGGEGASGSDPGSCGGAEYNRLILAMDAVLRTALIAANTHKGANQVNGKPDIADIPSDKAWRDSHDLGGPHAPFDLSDETEEGAPRGQVHFFVDPSSTLANSPLGRKDLETLVDPNALEMDQDYDCVHSSNPNCSYVTYGSFCLPQPSEKGANLFQKNYGAYDPTWAPTCS